MNECDFFKISEGVDTITLRLKKEYVNRPRMFSVPWHKSVNGLKTCFTYEFTDHVFLESRTIFRKINGNLVKSYEYYCHIQFEALYQANDFKTLYRIIISLLYIKAYINIDINLLFPEQEINLFEIDSKKLAVARFKYLFLHYDRFATLEECDFFFDFNKNLVKLSDKGKIYRSTVYTKDHLKSKSLITSYDRQERLKKVNHVEWTKIDTMPYSQRVEFRLCRGNTKYINVKNLEGTQNEILQRHANLLAKIWRKHGEEIGQVKPSLENPTFNYIQLVADSGEKIKHQSLLKWC